LTNSRGLARIKAQKGKQTPDNKYIKQNIREAWRDNKLLQRHVLGLLNFYGITVKSKYMAGEVAKVVQKLMEMNPQILNTFMNELIKILENDPRNKLTFLFEPVAANSGTLAVEGAPPIYTRVNLRDSNIRQSIIDKLEKEKVPEADTIKWYDTLIESINEQDHARYAATGGENNEKGREKSRDLLFQNIQSMLIKLETSRKTKFSPSLIKELAELIYNTFKEPITVQTFREIITTPIYETADKRLDPTAEAGVPRPPDITEANRVLQAVIGYRIYYDTVFSWKEIEIVKAPRNPDEAPPPDDPDDPNPPVQYYWIRKIGRPWIKVNVRVLILIISVISASSGIAYEIIKAIKDEHTKDKPKEPDLDISNKEPEKPKEKTKEKEKDTYVRPKRTKRHGELP
jgi:hypothetical protein